MFFWVRHPVRSTSKTAKLNAKLFASQAAEFGGAAWVQNQASVYWGSRWVTYEATYFKPWSCLHPSGFVGLCWCHQCRSRLWHTGLWPHLPVTDIWNSLHQSKRETQICAAAVQSLFTFVAMVVEQMGHILWASRLCLCWMGQKDSKDFVRLLCTAFCAWILSPPWLRSALQRSCKCPWWEGAVNIPFLALWAGDVPGILLLCGNGEILLYCCNCFFK